MKTIRNLPGDGRIGVLMGGWSAEREVSLRTGDGVAAALEARGHRVARLVWDRDGAGVDELVREAGVDIVFLALHGRGGEDGCVQGVLELLGVPYTGSGVLASALAMDKVKSKEMFRLHNVPTPPYYAVTRGYLDEVAGEEPRDNRGIEEVHGSFGFPVVVKPLREGSSVGVAKVCTMAELAGAIQRALAYDDHVLVERFVRATEVHVGILAGRVLGAVEVVPDGELYTYAAKYVSARTQYFCPPRIPATRLRGVMNLADRAARALGCTGACRVDLLVTEGENEYVLEVNTLPGMTPTSLLPKIAAAAGIDYGALCEAILHDARLHAGLPSAAERLVASERAPQRSEITVDDDDESVPLPSRAAG